LAGAVAPAIFSPAYISLHQLSPGPWSGVPSSSPGAFYIAERRAHTLETKASGTEVSFASGDADIHGSISPTRTYRSRTGHWCREFSEIVESGDVREHRRGLACREDSGGWQRLETTISGKPEFPLIR
jgi:hypothetical protein